MQGPETLGSYVSRRPRPPPLRSMIKVPCLETKARIFASRQEGPRQSRFRCAFHNLTELHLLACPGSVPFSDGQPTKVVGVLKLGPPGSITISSGASPAAGRPWPLTRPPICCPVRCEYAKMSRHLEVKKPVFLTSCISSFQ